MFRWFLTGLVCVAGLVSGITTAIGQEINETDCGARRMADSAALLVDEILPYQLMRQWVLSVPFPLRFLFASQPAVMGKVLGIVYRTIAPAC